MEKIKICPKRELYEDFPAYKQPCKQCKTCQKHEMPAWHVKNPLTPETATEKAERLKAERREARRKNPLIPPDPEEAEEERKEALRRAGAPWWKIDNPLTPKD